MLEIMLHTFQSEQWVPYPGSAFARFLPIRQISRH